jgi:cell wall-associated NlpC family hydrolase
MSSYRGFHRLLCAVALAAAAAGAMAAPDGPGSHASGDAVLQLLHERGLLSAASQEDANAVVHRMRDAASEMVLSAMNFLGVPYKRGGDSAEEGFDCSGFTRHIFEMSIGMVLPRRADQQAQQAGLLTVKRDELKPGDLVFFNTMRRAFSHVGIYVGDGKFIHAPRTGSHVRVEDMRQAYWVKRYNGARRAEQTAGPADAARPSATTQQTAFPSGNPERPSGNGD